MSERAHYRYLLVAVIGVTVLALSAGAVSASGDAGVTIEKNETSEDGVDTYDVIIENA